MTTALYDEGYPTPADVAAHQASVVEWTSKWRYHCKSCGGWGGSTFQQSHGSRFEPSETMFDVCEALPPERCHRCDLSGLNLDGEGPCAFCGWNQDDGVPKL